jgi:hypothetical protein
MRKQKERMPTARCPVEYKDGLKGCGRVFTIEEFFDNNVVRCSYCGLFFKVQAVSVRGILRPHRDHTTTAFSDLYGRGERDG